MLISTDKTYLIFVVHKYFITSHNITKYFIDIILKRKMAQSLLLPNKAEKYEGLIKWFFYAAGNL